MKNYEQHGLRKTPEYEIWAAMKARCYNKNDKRYSDWGGRGITVHEEWRKSFLAWYTYVGPRPSATHSMDRKDNDKPYEPGNVGWVTVEEQNCNQRDNHLLTFQGETMTLSRWAKRAGISQQTLSSRINRLKWPIERALTERPHRYA